jgi:hypothetical protein
MDGSVVKGGGLMASDEQEEGVEGRPELQRVMAWSEPP